MACKQPQKISDLRGDFALLFKAGSHEIPARLRIDNDGRWIIHNGSENIMIESLVLLEDSFYLQLPLFDTHMSGRLVNGVLVGSWTDRSRENYQISFTGKPAATIAIPPANSPELRYHIVFSPNDSSSASAGIALLQRHGDIVTGTVLTETGDYRFLEGRANDDSLWLSAFDGTHLFYLKSTIKGDSLVDGIFLSGSHWQQPWIGVLDDQTALRDPFDITRSSISCNPVLQLTNSSGILTTLDSSIWNGHVSIIQIMGSWCPNCTDESRFLKSIYDKYAERGLQIIPVAFERGSDVSAACARVQKQFNQLGLNYPFYYGGQSGKDKAREVFPFLDKVRSFPTTIFIDRQGCIRKIYTGFYGPGTGDEYTAHSSAIENFVDSLINE